MVVVPGWPATGAADGVAMGTNGIAEIVAIARAGASAERQTFRSRISCELRRPDDWFHTLSAVSVSLGW